MKKLLFALLLGTSLAAMVLPAMVLAVDQPIECCKIGSRSVDVGDGPYVKGDIVGPSGGNCPADVGAITDTTEKWGLVCAINTANIVVNWVFLFFVVLAVLLTLFGAFDLLTAAGNSEKVTSGRNKIMYAAIGLIVGLFARVIPSLIKAVVGY